MFQEPNLNFDEWKMRTPIPASQALLSRVLHALFVPGQPFQSPALCLGMMPANGMAWAPKPFAKVL